MESGGALALTRDGEACLPSRGLVPRGSVCTLLLAHKSNTVVTRDERGVCTTVLPYLPYMATSRRGFDNVVCNCVVYGRGQRGVNCDRDVRFAVASPGYRIT